MQDLEYIDDYFRGALSPEENLVFEQRIENDNAFAEEVAFYVSALQVMRNQLTEESKTRFKQLYEKQKEERPPQPGILRKLVPYIAAAAVIAAIVIGINLLGANRSPEQLAENYIKNDLKIGVQMASHMDSVGKGRNLFTKGQVAESFEQFKLLDQTHPYDYFTTINAGIAALHLQKYDTAIIFFSKAEMDTSLYANSGKFLHAVTLLKRNGPHDKQDARTLLQEVVDKNLAKKELAVKWLKRF